MYEFLQPSNYEYLRYTLLIRIYKYKHMCLRESWFPI